MGAPHRLIGEIDLNAIIGNWRRMDILNTAPTTAAVVKADAYGHGAEAVAGALYAAGCRVFFTTNAVEGAQIRPYVKDAVIGYFDGLFVEDIELIRAHRLTPSINDAAQIRLLKILRGDDDALPPVMVQVDTGMNRLGLTWDWFDEKRAAILEAEADIKLIYSHLASADEADSSLNAEQLRRFTECRRVFPTCPASLAASGGALLGAEYHFDLIRPGIALYGYPPLPVQGFTPALTLRGRVMQIRHARKGEFVSYNATHQLTRDSVLATIGGGYADGFSRQLSNQGRVWSGQYSAPILGRVTMDAHVVDVTDWPESVLAGLDWVTLMDDAQAAALLTGTICYDVLVALSLRARRTYIKTA